MEEKKKNDNRMTLYLTNEISKGLDKAENEGKKVGEKKHTIILKCIASGLKSLYGIEI